MQQRDIAVRHWPAGTAPDEASIRRVLADEALHPYAWSNGPGDVYPAHSHTYDKVIYVVHGSIAFGLPERGEQVRLRAGDRLDLPAGIAHDAVVGPEGVVCLEAHLDVKRKT
jgi:quercetin dioxygenase-like cupin family protein